MTCACSQALNFLMFSSLQNMFSILTSNNSNCLIIRELTKEGGRLTVKKDVGTALVVNVVTGCLFTMDQAVLQ